MKALSCPRMFEVEALRDGRLSGEERHQFERHLSSCGACAAQARALSSLGNDLRELCDASSDELRVRRERTRLLAAFNQVQVTPRRSRGWRVGVWSVAGSCVLIAALGLSRSGFWPLEAASLDAPPSAAPHAPLPAVVQADPAAVWSRQVDDRSERIVLQQGSLRVAVTHAEGHRPLLVLLPDGELEDRGTVFQVRVDEGRTTYVAVEEGSIVLRLRERAPVMLAAGEAWPRRREEPSLAEPSTEAARSTRPSEPAPGAKAALATEATSVARRSSSASSLAREAAAPPSLSVDELSAGGGARPAPNTSSASASVSNVRGASRSSPASASPPADAGADFRAAMSTFNAGEARAAASQFGRFLQQHSEDPRAEDAAYLRVLALRQAGDPVAMQRAAREYLARYPAGFRRREVQHLAR